MSDKTNHSLEEVLDIINALPHLDKCEAIQTIVDKFSGDALIHRDLKKSIDKHVVKIMYVHKNKINALSYWLRTEGYIGLDNMIEYNAGDRKMCYLGNFTDNDVLYFENQNMNMVMVLNEGYETRLHVRLVYRRIEDNNYGWFSIDNNYAGDLDAFKEKLKAEDGIAFAISNLTSKFHQSKYSDVYPGNKYPCRIDLQTMIDNKFKKGTPAFKYLNSSDDNYVYSDTLMGECDFSENMAEREYLLTEILEAIENSEIPSDFYKKYFREESIKEIID